MGTETFKFSPHMKDAWEARRNERGVWKGRKDNSGQLLRHGAAWNDAEKRHLLGGYLIEGKDVGSLARRHHRGDSGIAMQLNRLMDDAEERSRLMRQLAERECSSLTQYSLGAALSELRGLVAERDGAGFLLHPHQKKMLDTLAKHGSAFLETRVLDESSLFKGSVVGAGAALGQEAAAAQSSRPNADIIRAYANGVDVQYQYGADPVGPYWADYDSESATMGVVLGDQKYTWRIKPEKKEFELRVDVARTGGLLMSGLHNEPNLRLTFELGQLISAKPMYKAAAAPKDARKDNKK